MAYLYLEDLEPVLVVLGDFVCSDQLNVVAITWVAHYIVLRRKKKTKTFLWRNIDLKYNASYHNKWN